MASLHKDPFNRSPFWFVSYRTPDGRQRMRSTKETNRAKAEACARAIEEGIAKHKVGAFTDTAARVLISELFEELSGKKLQFKSIAAWFSECLESGQKGRRVTTQVRYRAVVGKFLEFLGSDRARAPLDSLEAADIQRFADSRLGDGRAVKTVSNDLKPIGFFLKEAERKGFLLKSPMAGVELPEDEGESRDPFSVAELELLLEYLSATKDSQGVALTPAEQKRRRNWLTVTTVGLCTGARLGDCANMRWSNVDFQGKKLRFVPEKGRKKKELPIPMHSDFENYLLGLQATDRRPDGYLAPLLGGATAGRRGALSKAFGSILEDAGIDRRPGKGKKGVGRVFYKLGFHSLRHTFNSKMADAGVSSEIRARLTGHSSVAMNDRYTHFADETRRKAIEAITPIPRKVPKVGQQACS